MMTVPSESFTRSASSSRRDVDRSAGGVRDDQADGPPCARARAGDKDAAAARAERRKGLRFIFIFQSLCLSASVVNASA